MRWMAVFLFLMIIGVGCNTHHSEQEKSPYVGQEDREIKSLTHQEVQGYLNGEGMGLSKVAELNNFPGPKHVLEFSKRLDLSEEQLSQIKSLYDEMKRESINLGERYISAEKKVNVLFEQSEIDPGQVDSLISDIGVLHSEIRATHVIAHIKMTELLSAEQIDRYQKLRGYTNSQHQHQMGNH